MTPVSAPLLATRSLSASHGTDRERLASAAKAFEAIFVRQMLSAARQAGFGDSLIGGQGLDTFRSMQDSQFADMTAQTGTLGLAKQIEVQLARHLPAPGVTNGQ